MARKKKWYEKILDFGKQAYEGYVTGKILKEQQKKKQQQITTDYMPFLIGGIALIIAIKFLK